MAETPSKSNFASVFQMPKIKTVYIHGLDSEPRPEKLEIMAQAGLEVSALHIDYRTEKSAYSILKQLVTEKKAELIIGSSLGGMLGFWLSEELGLPCLLFNPAMEFHSIEMNIPKITTQKCPLRIVVLGENDDVVDPLANKKFFTSREHTGLDQKVLMCSWLGHSIDFQTFEEMVFFAARNHSVWKIKSFNN